MLPAAYYNEINPYAADWLRNLIAAGHIAPGDVDERSIEDVHPDDLRSYTQCHFFAGVGVWSYALRRAGWPDDRPVWTGSCPCQPFSAAGKGTAFDDERHLWPAWHWLIQECRPPVIFGEQVASKDAVPWLDLVQTDLEALGYDSGAIPFPSAGIGAPHIRDRTYFVAHAQQHDRGRQAAAADNDRPKTDRPADRAGGRCSASGELGNAADQPCQRDAGGVSRAKASEHGARVGIDGSQPVRPEHAGASVVRGMAHTDGGHAGAEREQRGGEQRQQPADGGTGDLAAAVLQQRSDGQPGFGHEHDQAGRNEGAAAPTGLRRDLRPGPVNGFWRASDWLLCRDGKWRPVEPGTFPLAHGAPARVGRLRAYGNAINAQQAQIFIEEAIQCL